MTDRDLLGVILAGGASLRFGRTKAVEPLAGRPMAAWAHGALEPHARRVVVVGDGAVGDALGVEARPDLEPGLGPLGGLRTGLLWAQEEGREEMLLLACDLPLVPPGLVGALAGAGGGDHHAVVPSGPGPLGVEPLCAAYSVRALPTVEEALADGERAIHALLERLSVRILAQAEVEAVADPATAFLNVNTRDAAERARALLAARVEAAGAGG